VSLQNFDTSARFESGGHDGWSCLPGFNIVCFCWHDRFYKMLAAFRLSDFDFWRFHCYQECPFKNLCDLYNILNVSTSRNLKIETQPTFIANVLC
jgi:hypothetical protein